MAQEVNLSREDIACRVRSEVRQRIGSERFDLWISESTTWKLSGNALTLGFDSEFAIQLCRKTLGSEIGQVLREIIGKDNCEVRFELDAGLCQANLAKVELTTEAAEDVCPARFTAAGNHLSCQDPKRPSQNGHASGTTDRRSTFGAAKSGVRPQANGSHADLGGQSSPEGAPPTELFSNLIVGSSNQMACAAIKMAVSEPGRLSPIVLHGPPGCGKSLMLDAITQRLRGAQRMRRIVYMTSEQFTNEFTEGLRGGGLPMFRRKYRDVEALLLDDFQFFSGKKSTIAEVQNTIDNLLRMGKQIVLTIDRPLSELHHISDDLLGKLRGGLVTPIFPLDSDIRLGLLNRLVTKAGLEVEPAAIRQLAERISGDGRLICGVINRLTAVASVHPGKLSWDRCWSAVFDLIQASHPIVRLEDIERAVCGMFGLQPDSLQSQSKMRSVSQPRMLAMFLARKYTPAAYKEIGDYFGRRRHSTVISAEKTVESWLTDNARLEGPRHLTARDAIRHVESQLQVG